MSIHEKYDFKILDMSHFVEAAALWKQTEGLGLINDSVGSIKNYLLRNKGMSFVCIESSTGKVVGTNLAGHDGRRGYMYHLAVNKEHRGHGIGKTLVEMSVEAIKKEGITRCIIMVKTGNDGGHEFWESIGWKRREDLNAYSVDL